jgi:hypothetical protein
MSGAFRKGTPSAIRLTPHAVMASPRKTMNSLWIAVFVPALVQFALFLRWLHRRVRDDEIQRAFVRDLACSHLPHLYNALRHIADEMGIHLSDPPPLRFMDSQRSDDASDANSRDRKW